MKISTILDHIDSGHMALPEFQRGYVWNRDQVRDRPRQARPAHVFDQRLPGDPGFRLPVVACPAAFAGRIDKVVGMQRSVAHLRKAHQRGLALQQLDGSGGVGVAGKERLQLRHIGPAGRRIGHIRRERRGILPECAQRTPAT